VADHRAGGWPLPRGHDRVQADLGGEGDAGVDRVDRAARDARGDEDSEPLGGRALGQQADQERAQLHAVSGPGRVGGEEGVVTEVRSAEGLAQLAELGVVADRDDQVAVAGGERLVGVHAGVGVAHPERDHPARGVRAGLVHHPGQGAGHQTRLHELALAGRGPVVERGEDRDGGVQPRDHVEHRDA
jgi:hypothetical protein